MAQLKEGSVIKKSTGDEIIATETQLNNHNTDVAAHNDIRQQINALDTDVVTHKADAVKHITSAERTAWNNKAEVSQIPTKVSQLENDRGYVTQEELGDAGYGDMLKSVYDTDNDGKVDMAEAADSVPWDGVTGKPGTFPPSSHNHDERYYTESEIDARLSNKVDKIAGKGLSSNDYTTAEKNKLAGIEAGANNYSHPSSHPASMITESTSRRFVSDTEKSTWNNNKITIGKTQPDSGWWFEEID